MAGSPTSDLRVFQDKLESELDSLWQDIMSGSGSSGQPPTPPSTPRVLKWSTEVGTDKDKVIIPSCGGLFRDTKKGTSKATIVPFVGTDPDNPVNTWTWSEDDSDWVIDPSIHKPSLKNIRGPSHAGQFRPLGADDQTSTQSSCSKYKGTLLQNIEGKGLSMSLKTYKDTTRKHMISQGMWDVFSIPDPKNKQVKWDLFSHLGRLPLDAISQHVKDLRANADKYIIDNLDWSGDYLRASLHSTLLSKVLDRLPISASGPEVLSATHAVIQSSTFEVMEDVRDQLKAISLSNYPGENIDKCCAAQLVLLQRMEDAGYYQPEHLSFVTRCWKKCSDPAFLQWALKRNDEVSAYREKLTVMDASTIPPNEVIKYDTLIKSARAEYKKLVDEKDWVPLKSSTKSSSEPELPAGYAAVIETAVSKAMTAAGKTQHPSILRNGGGGGGGGGGKRVGFEKGNRSRRNNSNNGNSDPRKDKGGDSSKKTPAPGHGYWARPKDNPDQATKVHKGKTMYYCTICKRWEYHNKPGHDEAMAKKKKGPQASVAAKADAADDSDFIQV